MIKEMIKKMMKKMTCDLCHRGSFAEIRAHQEVDDAAARAEADTMFKKADADDDGFLHEKELAAYMQEADQKGDDEEQSGSAGVTKDDVGEEMEDEGEEEEHATDMKDEGEEVENATDEDEQLLHELGIDNDDKTSLKEIED